MAGSRKRGEGSILRETVFIQEEKNGRREPTPQRVGFSFLEMKAGNLKARKKPKRL
jgi:hypothetical protein